MEYSLLFFMSSSFEQECSAYAINSEEDIMGKNGIPFKQEISHELPANLGLEKCYVLK